MKIHIKVIVLEMLTKIQDIGKTQFLESLIEFP